MKLHTPPPVTDHRRRNKETKKHHNRKTKHKPPEKRNRDTKPGRRRRREAPAKRSPPLPEPDTNFGETPTQSTERNSGEPPVMTRYQEARSHHQLMVATSWDDRFGLRWEGGGRSRLERRQIKFFRERKKMSFQNYE
jgi:hypothetical protein